MLRWEGGVHSSHVAKFSSHSLRFESENKKRGDFHRLNFLNTFARSDGGKKNFMRVVKDTQKHKVTYTSQYPSSLRK
jgi:hypothetical protein